MLAIQVALNAVYNIRILFLVQGGRSDADTMARLFVAPAWFWAGLWMARQRGACSRGRCWITRHGRAR